MKRSWLLFGLLLALWLVLGALLLVPESKHARGLDHAHYPDMAQGGPGLERHEPLLWLGWAFGAVQILVFALVLSFGIRRDRLKALIVPLFLGGALMLALFTGLIVAYQRFLTDTDVAFLGPLPAPTMLVVLGVWAAPFYFVVLYVVVFSRCIWTGADADRFRQLMRDRRAVEERH